MYSSLSRAKIPITRESRIRRRVRKESQEGGPKITTRSISQHKAPHDKTKAKASIPFSHHHGVDPENDDHGSGPGSGSVSDLAVATTLSAIVSTSWSLKAYRSFGNDLVQAAIHSERVGAQSSQDKKRMEIKK